jgi:hypothetical protein
VWRNLWNVRPWFASCATFERARSICWSVNAGDRGGATNGGADSARSLYVGLEACGPNAQAPFSNVNLRFPAFREVGRTDAWLFPLWGVPSGGT